jgi:hypothetical protein
MGRMAQGSQVTVTLVSMYMEENKGSLVGLPKAASRLPFHLRAISPNQDDD